MTPLPWVKIGGAPNTPEIASSALRHVGESMLWRGGVAGYGPPISHDAEVYKERNAVEHCINKIKAWRGVAMRSDMRPESYLAGLQLRGSIIWLRSLRPAT